MCSVKTRKRAACRHPSERSRHAAWGVGVENQIRSRSDAVVLVDEPAEQVPPVDTWGGLTGTGPRLRIA